MEVCTATAGAISNFTHLRLRRNCAPNHTHHLQPFKTSHHLCLTSIPRTNPGLLCYTKSSLRSTTSEETSTGANQYVKDELDGVIAKDDANENCESGLPEDDSPGDDQMQLLEFLEKLNIKFELDDSNSILLFGGGTLFVLYLATAIVGAIDSIPVFPKLMEVVGLVYTVWFSTRYLIFKQNRDELAAKIEEIKQQVLGSSDD